jgi:hypothetical protein
MTVMNTNRIAYCPLCNKLINRRNITKNKKIGNLVEKVQNLIDSIGKDTGFDSKYELGFSLFPYFVNKKVYNIIMPMSVYKIWYEYHV